MKTRSSSFEEAVEIELEHVDKAMKEAAKIAKSKPKLYPSFSPENAYPALIARAVNKLADSEDPEDLAHNLVHLAACAESYFHYFVASVSIEEDEEPFEVN